jgi:capsid protein
VDPEKEVASYKDAVRCGFMTQAQVVAELGSDLHELTRARAEEVKANNQLDLVFDTDPAQVRRDGMKQADQIAVDSLPTEAEAPADGSPAT